MKCAYFVWFCNKKFLPLLFEGKQIEIVFDYNLKCVIRYIIMYIICWYLMQRMSLFHQKRLKAMLNCSMIARISNCANKANSKIHRASKLVHLGSSKVLIDVDYIFQLSQLKNNLKWIDYQFYLFRWNISLELL